ncbi:3-keto-disaccharide hydrolase [Dyadobacter aurulentus]|uniref:3-keto-disaccharide hydrolase n=1 Tax=Dyadobacter sp. UC 10 TaxID=2605428 RepID=UPI0011F1279F|nr:DUF1080 domain-containing protein [Dyadobacter sp. UC 10]KAA0993439.1 DUF1080 domain-containing protein [Dyadobacter sp. UC 10]
MRKLFFLSLIIALSTCHTLTFAQKKQPEEIPLFDGNSLDGWYSFISKRGKDNDIKSVFSVKNGLIHVSGEEYGSIVTNNEYENYKLLLEFKWGEKTYAPRIDRARDSGLLVHSTGPDGGYRGIWMRSIECQIIEGGTGDLLVVGDGSDSYAITATIAKKTGTANVFIPGGEPLTVHSGRIDWFGRDPEWRDEKGFRGRNDLENPLGEWNTIECIARDDSVSIYLNGTLVNQATAVKPSRGRIQLQSEGAEMFVRKVSLFALDPR